MAVEDLFNDGPFKVRSITISSMEMAPTRLARASTKTEVTRIYDFAADGNPANFIDSDWDGASDLHELLAGTDELDPEAYFAMRCFNPSAQGLCITWSSVEGKRYALYRATQLDGDFELIADDLEATPPENMYADAAPVDNAFYQISVH